jgi:hypothetical protein
MSLHLFFSNMKFQANLLTRTPVYIYKNCFCSSSTETGQPNLVPRCTFWAPKSITFPMKYSMFLLQIFKTKFHCIKSIIFCVIYLWILITTKTGHSIMLLVVTSAPNPSCFGRVLGPWIRYIERPSHLKLNTNSSCILSPSYMCCMPGPR